MASFVTSRSTIEPETPAETAQFVRYLDGTVARDRSDASYDRPLTVPEA